MCHHFEYDRLDELSEVEREELRESHSREELEEELSADELAALEPSA